MISRGARGGQQRRTQIVTLASGDEELNASWANSRRAYDAAYGIRRADDLAAVITFFEARNDRLRGFRWKDWAEYKSCLPSAAIIAFDQPLGTGNPVELQRSCGRVQVENRPRAGHCADFHPSAAGETAETPEPGRPGTRGRGAAAGVDLGELEGGATVSGRWTGIVHWHILPIKMKERAVATRNVVLTDTQSDLVDRLVATGRYQNASEALRAGLRLLEREESELGALRDRLTSGIEQARSGVLAEGSGEEAVRRAFAAARTVR